MLSNLFLRGVLIPLMYVGGGFFGWVVYDKYQTATKNPPPDKKIEN